MSNKKTFVIKPKTIKFKEKHVYPAFLKDEHSPFDDQYDLASERNFLGELADSDELEFSHPSYLQFAEYKKHEMAFKQYIMAGKVPGKNGPRYKNIDNIDINKIEVLPDEAALFKRMGKLRNETTDTMLLHTVHAFRLWKGAIRADGSDKKYSGVTAAIANTKKLMLIATGYNNPYADMSLIDIETRITRVKNNLKQRIEFCQKTMDAQKAMGLSLSIMISKEPMEIELSFDSPYGHLFTQVLGQFDYYTRMMITLKNKALIEAQQSKEAIQKEASRIRSIAELTHDTLGNIMPVKTFNRDLLLTKISEDMATLFTSLAENYGQIPEDVLLKKKHPDFTPVFSGYNDKDAQTILTVANHFNLVRK